MLMQATLNATDSFSQMLVRVLGLLLLGTPPLLSRVAAPVAGSLKPASIRSMRSMERGTQHGCY
ncbi:MAG TPA: hypothetical protein V6C99_12230 [Oculatellaceae cyanobacterium]|jgi:hypothetical protein